MSMTRTPVVRTRSWSGCSAVVGVWTKLGAFLVKESLYHKNSTIIQFRNSVLFIAYRWERRPVMAACQMCGAALLDPRQRFCGGDRCLQVLARLGGPAR